LSTVKKRDSGRKEAVVVLATQMSMLFISLANQSILAWNLETSGRGEYAILIMISSLAGVIFGFGADRASQYFVMSNSLSLSKGITTSIIVTVFSSTLGFVTLLWLKSVNVGILSSVSIEMLFLSSWLIPLVALTVVFHLQLSGQRMFKVLGFILLLEASVNIILMVLFSVSGDLNIETTLYSKITSSVVMLSASYFLLRNKSSFKIELPTIKEFYGILSYGLKYYVARLGNVVDLNIGLIGLGILASSSEVGIYAAAVALVIKILIFSESIEAVILPRISNNHENCLLLVEKSVRQSAILTAAFMIFLCLISEPFVNIFLSPKFSDVGIMIWLLAPGIIIHGMFKILMAYFRGINMPGVCSIVIWVGLSINLIALLSLYPLIGVYSGAVALVLSFFSRSIVLIIFYRAVNKKRWMGLFNFNINEIVEIRDLVLSYYRKIR